jgi:hypothetical protein
LKIPLKLRKRFDEYMAFVSFIIRAPQYNLRLLLISALVDTGSPWTSLAPMDSKILNVPIRALRGATDHPRIMFAGDYFWRLLIHNVELFLKDQDGGDN